MPISIGRVCNVVEELSESQLNKCLSHSSQRVEHKFLNGLLNLGDDLILQNLNLVFKKNCFGSSTVC